MAAPLVRRRVNAPAIVVQTVAFAAPVALCLAVRRSRTRDVAVCTLQMWAYLAAYKTPHDDERKQTERVHIDYPIEIDRVLGLGELPTLRLQRALARVEAESGAPSWRALDRVLVWAHWAWFMVPHGSLAYILVRRRERFPRAAAMTYAVFDIGASVYWLAPTAPPWYAASLVGPEGRDTARRRDARGVARGREARGVARGREARGVANRPAQVATGRGGEATRETRRLMVEYGEHFWGDGWGPLYSVLGGNPLAAMPSLHFATSVMAALLLAETGPVAGTLGATYAAVLGFALVYLGEHYVVDLLAGAALTAAVRRLEPRAEPAFARVARAIAALEAVAHEGVWR
ncbi:MAG: phosphatase PAP2 family protein [Solirubrobacteraceae bacterium]